MPASLTINSARRDNGKFMRAEDIGLRTIDTFIEALNAASPSQQVADKNSPSTSERSNTGTAPQ